MYVSINFTIFVISKFLHHNLKPVSQFYESYKNIKFSLVITSNMAINLNKNRDSLVAAWKEVVDDKNPVNW
jgi:hypothetical protein